MSYGVGVLLVGADVIFVDCGFILLGLGLISGDFFCCIAFRGVDKKANFLVNIVNGHGNSHVFEGL